MGDLTWQQWQELLAQASVSQLVGRLHYVLDQQEFTAPDFVRWHLDSAYKIAKRQRQQAIREFFEVTRALRNVQTRLVFLKGAAYIAKDLPCSYGRTFADIDVLVDRPQLAKVEQFLKFADWLKTEVEDYDERYYRNWMHEIPPLSHIRRGTVLDVHHNILPSTNKDTPDVSRFRVDTVVIPNVGEIQTLADIDLLIHTAVHLFTESEFHNGFRDISDIDMLLRHFQQADSSFVSALINRANGLGLYGYVRLALRYSQQVFDTPIGGIDLSSLEADSKALTLVQDFCFNAIFIPNHGSCRSWRYKPAAWLLYWRGHLLRMPLKLLVPHLLTKTWMRIQDLFERDEAAKPEIPRN